MNKSYIVVFLAIVPAFSSGLSPKAMAADGDNRKIFETYADKEWKSRKAEEEAQRAEAKAARERDQADKETSQAKKTELQKSAGTSEAEAREARKKSQEAFDDWVKYSNKHKEEIKGYRNEFPHTKEKIYVHEDREELARKARYQAEDDYRDARDRYEKALKDADNEKDPDLRKKKFDELRKLNEKLGEAEKGLADAVKNCNEVKAKTDADKTRDQASQNARQAAVISAQQSKPFTLERPVPPVTSSPPARQPPPGGCGEH